MQFDSFSDFLAMGGYGFFVWLSFGFGLFLLLALTIQSKWAFKKTQQNILKKMQREDKLRRAAQLQNH